MKNSNEQAPIHDGVQTWSLDHWRELVALIDSAHANATAYIYRGQAHNWSLQSTLDRYETKFPRKKNYTSSNPEYFECPPVSRNQHLRAFKEASRGRVTESMINASDDEWWALARHHGLATPILDWTRFPFIALYFAFEEPLVRQGNELIEPTHRYVYRASFHLIERVSQDSERIPRTFVPTQSGTARFVAQAGLCMLMPRGLNLEEYVREQYEGETTGIDPHARAVLEIVSVPSTDRCECLKLLNKMGINRMSLFPDLDGSASYINALWELDFDSSLGAIDTSTGK